MIGKGTFEFEVEGKKIGFKFGWYAAGITEKIAGCVMVELFQRIHGQKILYNAKGEVSGIEPIPGLQTISLLHYFYGGAVAFSGNENLTIDEVGDQLSALGDDKVGKIFEESLRTFLPESKKKEPEKKVKKKTAKSGQ